MSHDDIFWCCYLRKIPSYTEEHNHKIERDHMSVRVQVTTIDDGFNHATYEVDGGKPTTFDTVSISESTEVLTETSIKTMHITRKPGKRSVTITMHQP